MSDASPEDCMQLSDLDGFLTGVAIGPELVLPSEWLPAVWGGEEPVFEDAEQARSVLGAIMGKRRVVVVDLPEELRARKLEGPEVVFIVGVVLATEGVEPAHALECLLDECRTHSLNARRHTHPAARARGAQRVV
jgi:hypothetical protein